MSKTLIQREGPITVYLNPVGGEQAYLTATLVNGSVDSAAASRAAYQKMASLLRELGMEVVHERIFGIVTHFFHFPL